MKKAFIISLLGLMVIPAFVVVATPTAEAACSYNGFINSGGKCARSFKENDFRFNPHYGFGFGFLDGYGGFDEDRLERIRELLALIEELQALLSGINNGSSQDIDIRTLGATNVDEDSATLRGNLNILSGDTAEVWFEYGTNRNDLDEETSKMELDDDGSFSQSISNLDGNRVYYFRALGEGEDGDVDRGALLSFRTDDEDDDSDDENEEPEAETENAENISQSNAELHGSVDMNDFDDGRVFFVFGENEEQIGSVEDDFNTYNEIDEDGDDLQKVLVDGDLDNSADYELDISGLDSDAEHFFSICVEYEDEDDDNTLLCGTIEDFETEN